MMRAPRSPPPGRCGSAVAGCDKDSELVRRRDKVSEVAPELFPETSLSLSTSLSLYIYIYIYIIYLNAYMYIRFLVWRKSSRTNSEIVPEQVPKTVPKQLRKS